MIYHVFANRSNAGDWLSALGIQSLLAPWSVEECLGDEPFVAGTLEALGRATSKDLVVIGGGGLFMDYFAPFWRGFKPVASRVPFCIWGVGCCDMKHERTLLPPELIEPMVRKSRMCVVRDALTRHYLSACGLGPAVPCPAVVAVPTSPPPARGALLHVDHYDNVGAAVYDAMVEMGRRFAERTGRAYRQTNNLLPAGRRLALQHLVELYASAELVVTSRLHGCILALATGRPVVAVSGDRKVESFMQAAGLEDWVCDLEAIGKLPGLLEALPGQPRPSAFVDQARAGNRAIAAEVRRWLGPPPANE